jgi:hypothetical protein
MEASGSLSALARRHYDQARHNYALYARLLAEGTHLDWAATALFYTALHLVDAHAVERQRLAPSSHSPFADHDERREYVQLSLSSISLHYRRLQDTSRRTRYEMIQPAPAALQHLHDERFVPLERSITRLLDLPSLVPPSPI